MVSKISNGVLQPLGFFEDSQASVAYPTKKPPTTFVTCAPLCLAAPMIVIDSETLASEPGFRRTANGASPPLLRKNGFVLRRRDPITKDIPYPLLRAYLFMILTVMLFRILAEAFSVLFSPSGVAGLAMCNFLWGCLAALSSLSFSTLLNMPLARCFTQRVELLAMLGAPLCASLPNAFLVKCRPLAKFISLAGFTENLKLVLRPLVPVKCTGGLGLPSHMARWIVAGFVFWNRGCHARSLTAGRIRLGQQPLTPSLYSICNFTAIQNQQSQITALQNQIKALQGKK